MPQAEKFQDLATGQRQKEAIFRGNYFPGGNSLKTVFSFPGHFDTNTLQGVEDEEEEEEEEEGKIELSLGLSLHGRFGVDPIRKKRKEKLTRSSSIPDFLNPILARDQNRIGSSSGAALLPPMQGNVGNLVRTCSLPVETEEEWRRRKEMQSLRRMEAKRKRSEKQQLRSCKAARSRCGSFGEESGLFEEVGRQDSGCLVKTLSGLEDVSPPGIVAAPSSQGSIGSQGSGSSGLSESESLHAQGTNKTAEARSPSSAPCSSQNGRKPAAATTKPGSPEGGLVRNGRHSEPAPPNNTVRIAMEEMPRVWTRGLGPDGKRIEGFLYGYKKGEEPKVLCVCHGNFFTPAEFVKHAGGDDVAIAQPLKHIVVNLSPLV